jgi:hypothetical protein
VSRKQLFERGEQTASRLGFTPETVKAVLEGEGKLTLSQALHCRVRYFSDGVVLGSKSFVEELCPITVRLSPITPHYGRFHHRCAA